MVFRRLALAASLIAFGSAGAAFADTGPKPTMSFAFSFDKPGVTIVSGSLLQCADAKCADPKPLLRLGPQGFGCTATTCDARAYGFADFAQLKLVLSDHRTLTSNVFRDQGFNAKYRVTVSATALKVQSL